MHALEKQDCSCTRHSVTTAFLSLETCSLSNVLCNEPGQLFGALQIKHLWRRGGLQVMASSWKSNTVKDRDYRGLCPCQERRQEGNREYGARRLGILILRSQYKYIFKCTQPTSYVEQCHQEWQLPACLCHAPPGGCSNYMAPGPETKVQQEGTSDQGATDQHSHAWAAT